MVVAEVSHPQRDYVADPAVAVRVSGLVSLVGAAADEFVGVGVSGGGASTLDRVDTPDEVGDAAGCTFRIDEVQEVPEPLPLLDLDVWHQLE